MKPFDETDIAAYHLGELPPRRARALEQVLRTDANLAAESEVYASMLRTFKGHAPLEVDEEMMEHYWQRIRYQLPRRALRPRFTQQHIAAIAATALVLAAVAVYVHTPVAPILPATPPPAESVSRPETNPESLPATVDAPAASPTVPPTHRSDHPKRAQPTMLLADAGKEPTVQALIASASDVAHSASPATDAVTSGTTLSATLPPLSPTLKAGSTLPPSGVAPAQPADAGSAAGHRGRRHGARHEHTTDVTVAMGGMLVPSRSVGTSGTEVVGATHAVSAIGSFHQQLRPAIGYRVTFSYSRPDFDFENRSYGGASINGRIYEVAGTYVVQGPRHGFLGTTVEAGAGLMTIVPTIGSSSTSTNRRAAGIVGATAEIALSKHIALQAGYRLQIFRAPDFQVRGTQFPLSTPVASSTLVSNEPTMGITYRFLRK